MSTNRAIQKYKEQRKRKVLGMLKQLALRIHKDELIVDDFGFWPSRVNNRVIFRIIVISRDDEQEIKNFQEFS